jgi:hypothetical protein
MTRGSQGMCRPRSLEKLRELCTGVQVVLLLDSGGGRQSITFQLSDVATIGPVHW